MRRLKIGLIAAVALVIAGITAPAPAIAQGNAGDTVFICHTSGHSFDALATSGGFGGGWQCLAAEGKVNLIEVSVSACKAHLGEACTVSQ